ncbi:MAG: DNA-binding protein [Frankiales bacterium]|nr:DNA-binding protein [Frankiales bacterium]
MPENRKQQHRLDPRNPLVLDTRELGRRPGSMREVQLSVPAPEGFELVDLIGVPLGADLDLDHRLDSVMDGVQVSGFVTAPVSGECGRCLSDVSDTLRVKVQELYVYPEAATEHDEEDDVSRLHGDFLDLAPVLRDAVVLALPLNPLCQEDCQGLCATCGERLDDLPGDHSHDVTDARWGALAGLLQQTDQEK